MSNYTHRRGSIFWALTLIAVGGLFLYHNFAPEFRPWEIIAKWWPILIIFWGLSKLIDYLHAQAHPETAPMTLFSGSEVVLLVLILLLGTMISHIVLHPWREWPGAVGINVDDDDWANLFTNSYTYTQTVSKEVKPQPRLIVVNRRGDVEVHTSDQKTLDAVVKETVRADNESGAKKAADQIKFEIAEEAGQYIFKSNVDSLPSSGRNVRLDIVLHVPKGGSVELTAERGDISVEGVQGDESLTARHGDVRVASAEGLVKVHQSRGDTQVRDVKGSVELDGRGGDVDVGGVSGNVTVSGDFSGAVQFRDVAQSLRFTSSRTELSTQRLSGRLYMEMGSLDARGVDGPFELRTRQKDITLDGFAHSLKISDANGEVRLRAASPPKQAIEVNSDHGGIELELPANSDFQIQADSRHGEVSSDFSGANLKVVTEGDAPSITGTHGKGGPLIRLTTTYGTIRLAHAGPQAPAPPEAPSAPGSKQTLRRAKPHAPHAPLVALRKFKGGRSDLINLLPILTGLD
jgi:putative adhesin/cell wall-active antibiotic response 4TMS protein YvqF